MSLASVFNIAGTGMSAQTTRLNTTASNIANAESVSSSIDQTYRARHPVFSTMLQNAQGGDAGSLFGETDQAGSGVQVLGVVETRARWCRATSRTIRPPTRTATSTTPTST
jgi:Flagellar basal body rod protein